MAPVGPFCPFSSSSFVNLEKNRDAEHRARMEHVLGRVDKLYDEPTQSKEELLRLSQELRDADSTWRAGLVKMRYADDFRTRELYQFSEALLQHLDTSMAEVEALAAWQADVLEANGRGTRIPPPPVQPQTEKATNTRSSLDSVRMGGAQGITLDLTPSRQVAESPVVQDELQILVRDHSALIQMGQGYGNFDSAGKELFLDQMARISERWDVYIARFQLMGEPAPSFIDGAADLLKRLGLTPDLARKLLSNAHDRMRKEAQAI